jgi:hypothetical protein
MRAPGGGRKCDRCQVEPDIIHVPLRKIGVFCPAHCPICVSEAQDPAAKDDNL